MSDRLVTKMIDFYLNKNLLQESQKLIQHSIELYVRSPFYDNLGDLISSVEKLKESNAQRIEKGQTALERTLF